MELFAGHMLQIYRTMLYGLTPCPIIGCRVFIKFDFLPELVDTVLILHICLLYTSDAADEI